MKSIIFIIPYFGKWPEWMPLYLDSIKRNQSIDFLFYTDCDTSVLDTIPNIKYKSIQFEEYVELYKPFLGNDIQILNPYKICDLRPFFALIHEDDINGYDFFGWTDTDIVFGDIRKFYTDKILNKYEVLSTHQIRLSGHCALLKNSNKYKNIGFKIYNWKSALVNPEFVGIDEHGITNALTMTFIDKVAEKMQFSKNNMLLNFLRKYKTRKYYFVEQYTTPFISIPWIDNSIWDNQPNEWFYQQGTITNSKDTERDFMYLHFMNFKSSTWRQNQSEAPWSKLTTICKGEFSVFAHINKNGIIYNS